MCNYFKRRMSRKESSHRLGRLFSTSCGFPGLFAFIRVYDLVGRDTCLTVSEMAPLHKKLLSREEWSKLETRYISIALE